MLVTRLVDAASSSSSFSYYFYSFFLSFCVFFSLFLFLFFHFVRMLAFWWEIYHKCLVGNEQMNATRIKIKFIQDFETCGSWIMRSDSLLSVIFLFFFLRNFMSKIVSSFGFFLGRDLWMNVLELTRRPAHSVVLRDFGHLTFFFLSLSF